MPRGATWAQSLSGGSVQAEKTLDDFEDDATGAIPDQWVYVNSDGGEMPVSEALETGEIFEVRKEEDNQFLHLRVENESMRFSRTKRSGLNWNVRKRPVLTWRWRALQLPEGASEKDQNDTGAALYVTFDTDWLGRPKSIKYTYSSSLPVGTVVDFGKLYVIVVDSKPASGVGEWRTVRRNVMDDYKRIFGGRPPERPLSVTIWSDSDTTDDVAEADFDDIRFRPVASSNP